MVRDERRSLAERNSVFALGKGTNVCAIFANGQGFHQHGKGKGVEQGCRKDVGKDGIGVGEVVVHRARGVSQGQRAAIFKMTALSQP